MSSQVFKAIDAFKKRPPKKLEQLDHVEPLIREAFKTINTAVSKGTLHKNTGARRKSRLLRYRDRLLIEAGLMAMPEKPKVPTLLEAYEAKKAARRAALKAASYPTKQA